jgi:putative flippase GtrA
MSIRRISSQTARARLPGLTRLLAAPVVLQFAKFGIVGISNTLLNFLVYILLLKVFGVWYLAASGIGFGIGAVNGFLLNRRWTFEGHVGDALTPVRWGIVQGSGLALNEALLYFWVDGVGVDKLIGQALAIVVVTSVTFAANRAWTFRAPAPAASQPASASGRAPSLDGSCADGEDTAIGADGERVLGTRVERA